MFGRLEVEDLNDWDVVRAMPTQVSRKSIRYTRFCGTMNQGNTGTCVSHGWKNWALTSPYRQWKCGGEPHPYALYDEIIKLDEWTENDNDTERRFGTSVRAGAKAMRARGMLNFFAFAFTIDDAINWLCSGKGGIVLGSDWFPSMMNTTDEGILSVVEGRPVYGHCTFIDEWDEERGLFGAINSWGQWGQRKKIRRKYIGPKIGRFYIPAEKGELLLKRRGDFCMAVETRIGS